MKIGSRKKMRSSSAKLSSLAPQCVSHGKKKNLRSISLKNILINLFLFTQVYFGWIYYFNVIFLV